MSKITRMMIQALVALIIFMSLYLLAELIFLVGRTAFTHYAVFNFSPEPIDRNKLFFSQVQGLVSAILLITILVELTHSLLEYLKMGSANYVSVIIEIALIAMVRHLLALDFEHVQPAVLFGIAALIFVLGFFNLVFSGRISSNKLLNGEKRNASAGE